MPTPDSAGRPPTYLPLLGAAGLMLGLIVYRAGIFSIEMLIGLSVDGSIVGLYVLAAWGYGSTVANEGPPSLRFAAAAALGLGFIGIATLLLGLAGVFNAIAAWMLIGGGVVLAVYRLRGVRLPAPTFGLIWCVPLAILLAHALLAACLMPGFLWKPLDPHPYDVLSYHLQVPREWYDAGRIIPLTHNAFSYFPMLMETHFLSAMHLRGGPWAGMYLCNLITLAHGVLTLAAVAGVAHGLGASRMRSTCAVLLTAGVPWVFQLSTVAYVETGVMLYSTLAVGFAAMALIRADPRKLFALAGVFAGLACGMKYTAFAMTAAPVCLIGIGLLLLGQTDREGFKRRIVASLLLIGATAVVASPWLIRNAVWTGNPVFPLASGVFGKAHFADDQVDRYRVAHSPTPAQRPLGGRLVSACDQTEMSPQYGFIVLPLGVLAAIATARRRTALMVSLSALAMAVVWFGATHILPRFLTPVLPLLAVSFALAPMPSAAAVALAGTQAAIGLAIVLRSMAPLLDGDSRALLYKKDLTFIGTDETDAAKHSSDRIALIGDANAFFYDVPSSRLIYRSVFDVYIPPGTSVVDGWLGKSVDELRRSGAWVIINTSELNRLCATYRHLPKPLPPFDQVRPEPIVLPPIR